jgi:hypothetical protein
MRLTAVGLSDFAARTRAIGVHASLNPAQTENIEPVSYERVAGFRCEPLRAVFASFRTLNSRMVMRATVGGRAQSRPSPIDPFRKLIDRLRVDNVARVEATG